VAGGQHFQQVGQRVAGVHDVFDHQHVPVPDGLPEVQDQAQRAGLVAAHAVARDGEEIHPAGDRERARQVGQEDE
jgi:hypothetical protein